MKRITISRIRVFRSALNHSRGTIIAGNLRIPCALGRSGTAHTKREGDGFSLIGQFGVNQAFYRQDKIQRPRTQLRLRVLHPKDGWCDAPNDRLYNRQVKLPYSASHEDMWREDDLYNIVLDVAINRHPIIKGRGSALFLHIARAGYTPTAGCIAVARKDILRLVALIGRETKIEIVG